MFEKNKNALIENSFEAINHFAQKRIRFGRGGSAHATKIARESVREKGRHRRRRRADTSARHANRARSSFSPRFCRETAQFYSSLSISGLQGRYTGKREEESEIRGVTVVVSRFRFFFFALPSSLSVSLAHCGAVRVSVRPT